MVTPLTKPSVRIDDHASAGRGSLRRGRDFCAGCTVRRNPKAARITARVSSRGLPRSESVRYSVSRESPVLSQKTPAHSLSLSEPINARDGFDWQSSLLDHLTCLF